MRRAASLSLFLCSASLAQTPDLAALEQTAQKRYADWESQAKSLEERLARILPCDARSSAAIAEVRGLSDARLAALTDYMRATSAKAFAETAAAKALLSAEERRAIEASRERADAGQEQTAVDIQSDGLLQSINQRSSLQDAQKLLEQIAALIRQRSAESERQANVAEKAIPILRDLVAKFEARDVALQNQSAAFEAERTRWGGYYSARQARAQTECSITQIGASGPGPAAQPAKSKASGKAKR
jgi:hypothetical protein